MNRDRERMARELEGSQNRAVGAKQGEYSIKESLVKQGKFSEGYEEHRMGHCVSRDQ